MTRNRTVARQSLRTGLRASALSGAVVVALAVPANAAPAATHTPSVDTDTVVLTAELTGAAEVPMAGGPAAGDPDGFGNAALRLRGDTVDFALLWQNIDTPTKGHIHTGAAGVNGDLQVAFFEKLLPGTTDTYVTQLPDGAIGVTGTVTDVDPAVVADIAADPQGFYVNLHNEAYPGGAIRGQLGREISPELGAGLGGLEALEQIGGLAGAGAAGPALEASGAFAALGPLAGLLPPGTFAGSYGSGNEVVAGYGDHAGGAPDGYLASLYRVDDETLDYAVAWSGIDPPTSARIQQGAAGTDGPAVADVFEVPDGLPSTVNGIIGRTGGGDAAGLECDTADFYTNVTTAEFPDGAVRGQLKNLDGLITGVAPDDTE